MEGNDEITERTNDKGEYMKKRWLAIGLSICLALSMFSTLDVRVSAEDAGVAPAEETIVPPEEGETTLVEDETAIPAQEGDVSEDEKEEMSEENEADISAEENAVPSEEESVTPVEIQIMDEYGNITYIMDEVSPVVEEPSMRARTFDVSDKVVNLRAKKNGTAADVKNPMNYTEYGTGKKGYVYGYMGADAAYLGTENGKVKFMISGVIGMVNEAEVQVVSQSAEKVSSYYANGTSLIHIICSNMNAAPNDYRSELNVGPQQSYMKTGTKYYSYDGHYFYTDYSVMLADYRNNTRSRSINAQSPYYNYYQYLPFRSTTGYTATQLSSKINAKTNNSSKIWNLGNSLITNQNTYGINALLAAGIAANESAWGRSDIAQAKNNIFGLNAVDNSPGTSSDTYSTVDACVKNFAEGWMSKRYLNPNNENYYGGFLGNKASGVNVKYASDPYWGEKAAAIAWGLDSEGKDRYKYTLGVKDVISGTGYINLNVRKESNASSAQLFTAGPQTDHSFLILGQSSEFYKVQSDPVLNSGRTGIDGSTGRYDFSKMYAYVSSNYVTVVSGKVNQGTPGEGTSPPGKTADTLAVRRGNTYYFKYSLSDGVADLTVPYGKASDEVLIGDWDGDGVDSLCVRRGNIYYFKNGLSGGEADYVVRYGRAGDEVLVGDWDGNGVDTLCVRRGNTYYIKNSLSDGEADITVLYGRANDTVLVGDWDGDGTDTLCVRRGNVYYFKNSLSNGEADSAIPYGRATDQILTGDWDGDGKDTLCVRRGNAYHIKNGIAEGVADQVVLYGKADDITYAGRWKK
ncbi:glucosaminidase domain-containing protein [Faecalicatena contorta]|uniref:Beta- N-acetylglucosaminidase n=1 Tax=Faecalicatena contorta TaxID=39482 RepID=A0A315ZS26_9FIRM|nr:glucosaminidase domain-containing protein [Faecalicatena contorta]PWJ48355.1 beta-N-acetylglucosaminidase [Faecalicatena contorta]SUQ15378.1 Beta- N-acetylglucosaminidase [Faecalicatena contorta]